MVSAGCGEGRFPIILHAIYGKFLFIIIHEGRQEVCVRKTLECQESFIT
jgi:hypothetical protein